MMPFIDKQCKEAAIEGYECATNYLLNKIKQWQTRGT